MTSTSTHRTGRRTLVIRSLAGAAAVAAVTVAVVNGPVAHADQGPAPAGGSGQTAEDRYVESLVRAHDSSTEQSQQDAYVASLRAAHQAAAPYSVQDDYVRTLVFWHENPDWTPGE